MSDILPGNPFADRASCVMAASTTDLVNAVMALAFEQRTANMIGLATLAPYPGDTSTTESFWTDLVGRFGK